MCIISDTMQQTLHQSQSKTTTSSALEKTVGWRVGFCDPMIAALQLGTPAQSQDPISPMPFGNGPMYID